MNTAVVTLFFILYSFSFLHDRHDMTLSHPAGISTLHLHITLAY